MGTRADYYVGRGSSAVEWEWLGSTALDGNPAGQKPAVLEATSSLGFRLAVSQLLTERSDATSPEQGWPWPWDDSGTTDYAYAFDGDRVWVSHFGSPWFDVKEVEPEYEETDSGKVSFPDMSGRKNVAWDERSGLLFFHGGPM